MDAILSMTKMMDYRVTGRAQTLNMEQMDRLAEGLTARNIDFIRKPSFDGEQIVVIDDKGNRAWDAVLHCGSYGHEHGLLEVMGEAVVRVDDDEVEGYLTAEEILSRI